MSPTAFSNIVCHVLDEASVVNGNDVYIIFAKFFSDEFLTKTPGLKTPIIREVLSFGFHKCTDPTIGRLIHQYRHSEFLWSHWAS